MSHYFSDDWAREWNQRQAKPGYDNMLDAFIAKEAGGAHVPRSTIPRLPAPSAQRLDVPGKKYEFLNKSYADMVRDFAEGEFYLYSYGSNNLSQMRQRLSPEGASEAAMIKTEDLKHNSWAASVKNYARAFVSHSTTWESGVATVIKRVGSKVDGIMHKIIFRGGKFYLGNTHIEINMSQLYSREGVSGGHYKFKRLFNPGDNQVTIYNKTTRRYETTDLPVWVYIGIIDNPALARKPRGAGGRPVAPKEFNRPHEPGYKNAIQRMLSDMNWLKGIRIEEREIKNLDVPVDANLLLRREDRALQL